MEPKTIIAALLVVFILGALAFLKIRNKKNSTLGRLKMPSLLHTKIMQRSVSL